MCLDRGLEWVSTGWTHIDPHLDGSLGGLGPFGWELRLDPGRNILCWCAFNWPLKIQGMRRTHFSTFARRLLRHARLGNWGCCGREARAAASCHSGEAWAAPAAGVSGSAGPQWPGGAGGRGREAGRHLLAAMVRRRGLRRRRAAAARRYGRQCRAAAGRHRWATVL